MAKIILKEVAKIVMVVVETFCIQVLVFMVIVRPSFLVVIKDIVMVNHCGLAVILSAVTYHKGTTFFVES